MCIHYSLPDIPTINNNKTLQKILHLFTPCITAYWTCVIFHTWTQLWKHFLGVRVKDPNGHPLSTLPESCASLRVLKEDHSCARELGSEGPDAADPLKRRKRHRKGTASAAMISPGLPCTYNGKGACKSHPCPNAQGPLFFLSTFLKRSNCFPFCASRNSNSDFMYYCINWRCVVYCF